MNERGDRKRAFRAGIAFFFFCITSGVGADFIGEELCCRRRVAWFWSSGVSFVIHLVYD